MSGFMSGSSLRAAVGWQVLEDQYQAHNKAHRCNYLYDSLVYHQSLPLRSHQWVSQWPSTSKCCTHCKPLASAGQVINATVMPCWPYAWAIGLDLSIFKREFLFFSVFFSKLVVFVPVWLSLQFGRFFSHSSISWNIFGVCRTNSIDIYNRKCHHTTFSTVTPWQQQQIVAKLTAVVLKIWLPVEAQPSLWVMKKQTNSVSSSLKLVGSALACCPLTRTY